VVQKWTRAVQDILLTLRVIPVEMNGPEVDPCGAPTFQFAQGVRFVLRFWCVGGGEKRPLIVMQSVRVELEFPFLRTFNRESIARHQICKNRP
jgi:hypothetical protein